MKKLSELMRAFKDILRPEDREYLVRQNQDEEQNKKQNFIAKFKSILTMEEE